MTSQPTPIITLEFHQKDGKGRIRASLTAAELKTEKAQDGGPDIKFWSAHLVLEVNGVAEEHNVQGACSLQPILIGLDYVRSKIPKGQETQWITPQGDESWCVLPKSVPYSWGYDLYKKISNMMDDVERRFVNSIKRP